MMKLHGFPLSPNTRRALFMLEECGAAYELVPVDLIAGEQRSEAYRALNPTGRVPTLVDGDFVLWESNAMLEYLAALHPARELGGRSPREIGDVARFLFMNASHLSPAIARIFAHTIRLPPEQRNPKLVEEGRAEADRSLAAVEQRLAAGGDFLVGRFTIADVSLAPSLALATMIGLDLARFPAVSAWMARVAERAAWKKVYG